MSLISLSAGPTEAINTVYLGANDWLRGRLGLPHSFTFSPKDPSDIEDYALDATAYLAAYGATLTNATVTIDPSLTGISWSIASGVLTMRVGGGLDGTTPMIGVDLLMQDANGLPLQTAVAVTLPVASVLPTGLVVFGAGSGSMFSGLSFTDGIGNRVADSMGNHLVTSGTPSGSAFADASGNRVADAQGNHLIAA